MKIPYEKRAEHIQNTLKNEKTLGKYWSERGESEGSPVEENCFFLNIYTHFFLIMLDRVAGHSIMYKSTHTGTHIETFFFLLFISWKTYIPEPAKVLAWL